MECMPVHPDRNSHEARCLGGSLPPLPGLQESAAKARHHLKSCPSGITEPYRAAHETGKLLNLRSLAASRSRERLGGLTTLFGKAQQRRTPRRRFGQTIDAEIKVRAGKSPDVFDDKLEEFLVHS